MIVYGGRRYDNEACVFSTLDAIDGLGIVIQGGASGADKLARKWAASRGIHCAEVKALWEFGRSAGPARNYAMLGLIGSGDLVVAFPGGTGTANMCSLAKRALIEVRRISDD